MKKLTIQVEILTKKVHKLVIENNELIWFFLLGVGIISAMFFLILSLI